MYQQTPTRIITNIYVKILVVELLLTTVFFMITKGIENKAVTTELINKTNISIS